MRTYSLEPKDLGIPRCEIKDLAGGDAAHNANLLMVAAPSAGCLLLQSCLIIAIACSPPPSAIHASICVSAGLWDVALWGPRFGLLVKHLSVRDVQQEVFGGERNAIADALNLNAGVALHAADVASSPAEGVARAQEAQRSGKRRSTSGQSGVHTMCQHVRGHGCGAEQLVWRWGWTSIFHCMPLHTTGDLRYVRWRWHTLPCL
jgi:Glycosyl transferase family, a/b domain